MSDDKARLHRLISEFRKRGGIVCLFPKEEEAATLGSPSSSNSQTSSAATTPVNSSDVSSPSVQLRYGDVVFPVCHQGQNRSQVMWAVVEDLNRSSTHRSRSRSRSSSPKHHQQQQNERLEREQQPLTVVAPHGAESGFDPYVTCYDVTIITRCR